MRVTVIGHAGLFIEADEATLLVDPWLSGSCYWRSWWHFPPSPEPESAWLSPTCLYLTHHHFDHFHYPSLRRIDRTTRVLVPYFGNDVMPLELKRLGFDNVTELPHGKTLEVAKGLWATSFQYGFDDSALVATDGKTVVCDLNDCKMRPGDLLKLKKRFGPPDLVLKSHSWAQGYPNCYQAEDPADLTLLSRQGYITDFIEAVGVLQPKQSVPFASMVCFLHPESWERNIDIVTPVNVAEGFARSPVVGSELVLMKPGDTWESNQPFVSDLGDLYSQREKWLEKLRQEAAPAIERSQSAEKERLITDAVTEYFDGFTRAVPRIARLLLRSPVVLHANPPEGPYWVLDWRHRRAQAQTSPPQHRATLIEVPPGVLADAVEQRIVHFIHISMRLKVQVRPGGIATDFSFWSLLALFELGYLPARKLLNRRFFSVAWHRRAEIFSMALAGVRPGGSLASRMTSRFMPPEEPYPSSQVVHDGASRTNGQT